MSVNLRWKFSPLANRLHPAAALLEGRRLPRPNQEAAYAPRIKELRDRLRLDSIAEELCVEHLIHLAAEHNDASVAGREFVEKTMGRGASAGARNYARMFGELEAVFRDVYPQHDQPISLGPHPLQHAWERWGTALMKNVAGFSEDGLVTHGGTVLMTGGVLGGHGSAHLLYNTARMEMIHPDPLPELPEVLRLCWVASQWNLELDKWRAGLRIRRLVHVGALAMVPIAVSAGAALELAKDDDETILLAVNAWKPVPDALLPDVGPKVVNWWRAYHANRPRWAAALGALNQMLGWD
ncbi:MAG: hypothetical protein N2C14_10870 [Planctomycetales bacterium]